MSEAGNHAPGQRRSGNAGAGGERAGRGLSGGQKCGKVDHLPAAIYIYIYIYIYIEGNTMSTIDFDEVSVAEIEGETKKEGLRKSKRG